MRKRVVCVWGDFLGGSKDFVLEPACAKECKCEVCKDAFWIEDVNPTEEDGEEE